MRSPFQIDLRSLPDGGLRLTGEEPPAFFDLSPEDTIQAESPLSYDLNVERDGGEVIVTGSLEAVFSLECGRCLERFQHRLHLRRYRGELAIEEGSAKDSTINLTDMLREDTLVSLPSYPRCEDGNVRPRQCPAEGKFEPDLDPVGDEPEHAGPGVWEALNKLN
jgi:uncharacterized metal-binding protein YceD (DUF177 family)